MTPQFTICLVAVSLTFLCFSGAMRLYFRAQGPSTVWQRVMKGAVLGSSVALYVAIWSSRSEQSGTRWLAILLLALAQILFWWSIVAHGHMRPAIAFSDEPAPRVVSWGPYRWIRHPFYTAYLLAWAAAALIALQPGLLVVTGVMGLIYAIAAHSEERAILESPLASEYSRLRETTGAFWPRLSIRRL